jgi:hypothetical protein
MSLSFASVGFLLGLLFGPGGGAGVFHQNVRLPVMYMALETRRLYTSLGLHNFYKLHYMFSILLNLKFSQ